MKLSYLLKAEDILEYTVNGYWIFVLCILGGIVCIIISPILLCIILYDYVERFYKRFIVHRNHIYDKENEEYYTAEEYQKLCEKRAFSAKLNAREADLSGVIKERKPDNPHFYMYHNRTFDMPLFTLMYVENEPCERLHTFFKDNEQWLKEWMNWYGFEFCIADAEALRRDLLYPSDFSHMPHGIAYLSNRCPSTYDYSVKCDIVFYYTIPTGTDEEIRDFFDLLAQNYYEHEVIF